MTTRAPREGLCQGSGLAWIERTSGRGRGFAEQAVGGGWIQRRVGFGELGHTISVT
jgi:hypothetical protein